MTFIDDRSEAQQSSHQYIITATDKCMSGWGGAAGGASKCGWCCETSEQAQRVLQWVENRDDMKYVNIRYPSCPQWRPNAAHVHLYVVGGSHPALNGMRCPVCDDAACDDAACETKSTKCGT